jgi:hypothetical protein
VNTMLAVNVGELPKASGQASRSAELESDQRSTMERDGIVSDPALGDRPTSGVPCCDGDVLVSAAAPT